MSSELEDLSLTWSFLSFSRYLAIRQCRFRGVLQCGRRTHMHGLLDMRDTSSILVIGRGLYGL